MSRYTNILRIPPPKEFALYSYRTTGSGGSSTSGAFRTLNFNVELFDSIGCSLSSNQITIPPGQYHILYGRMVYALNDVRFALYNASDTKIEWYGASVDTGATNLFNIRTAYAEGPFTCTETKVIEMRYRSDVTRGTNGLGYDIGAWNVLHGILRILKLPEIGVLP